MKARYISSPNRWKIAITEDGFDPLDANSSYANLQFQKYGYLDHNTVSVKLFNTGV